MGSKKNKVALALALIVAAAALGYLGHGYYKASPEYALARIRLAAAERDLDGFNEYVDVDSVISRGYDRVADSMDKKDGLLSEIVSGLARLTKPLAARSAKEAVEKWVTTGGAGHDADKTRVGGTDLKSLGDVSFRGIKKKGKRGEFRTVVIEVRDKTRDVDYEIELLMSGTEEGHLKVVEISNLPELLDMLKSEELERARRLNEPVREKLDRAVKILNIEKRAVEGKWVIGDGLEIDVTLRNESGKNISALEGELVLSPKTGRDEKRVSLYYHSMDLARGKETTITWPVALSPLSSLDRTIAETPGDRIKMEFTPEMVFFSDGEKIELPRRGIR